MLLLKSVFLLLLLLCVFQINHLLLAIHLILNDVVVVGKIATHYLVAILLFYILFLYMLYVLYFLLYRVVFQWCLYMIYIIFLINFNVFPSQFLNLNIILFLNKKKYKFNYIHIPFNIYVFCVFSWNSLDSIII